MGFLGILKTKRMTVEATVMRADGTVENIGVVAYFDISPVNRLLYTISGLPGFSFLRKLKRLQL